MAEPVLRLEHINKSFGSKAVVNNLSLEVQPGEIYGFIGPNGSGKTTTIRMILGLIRPTSGEVYINGCNVRTDYERAIERVGGIVESPELYKYLSGYNNLKVFSILHHSDPARIDQVVRFVGLQERIRDKVKKYSLGMRQRLGLAQAILHYPNLLILDEPMNGLDPIGMKQLRDTLKMLAREEHVAIFISSHLLNEIQLLCDRAAIIQHGTVKRVLDIHDLASMNAARAVYVFTVSDPVLAQTCLSGWEICGVDGADISLAIHREEIPAASKALIDGGVGLYGVRATETSLEDVFIQNTGVNVID